MLVYYFNQYWPYLFLFIDLFSVCRIAILQIRYEKLVDGSGRVSEIKTIKAWIAFYIVVAMFSSLIFAVCHIKL